MTINSAGGSRVYIGTTLAINLNQGDPQVIAEFATDTYTEVGEAEDVGEYGDEAEEITFTALKDSRVRKLKGPKNAGTIAVVTGDDPLDVGQDAMVAAEASNLDFNFKIELNDPVSLSGTPSVDYFRGKVMSKRKNVGNASNVVRRTFNVGINSAIYEVNPT
jgi:hypothetical protein